MAARARIFFKTHREWQWIKHLVLADYLRPWSFKVGSTASQVFVVDAFAGAGTYTDPDTGGTSDGSPVIAARRAIEYRKARPWKSMKVICIELDNENFLALEKRMAGFMRDGVADVRQGSFGDWADRIARELGRAPALILLDPIGIKSIDAETCAKVLQRDGKTDVFVVVDFDVVHRIGGQLLPSGEPNPEIRVAAANAATVDAFFHGNQRWRAIAKAPGTPFQREVSYLGLYHDLVLGGRYRYVAPYPVRAVYTQAERVPKYWLVHASDFIDAFLIMNDEVVKVDRELYRRTFARPGQIEGFAEVEYDAEIVRRIAALERDVLDRVSRAGATGVRFGHLRSALLPVYYGRVKSGAYGNTVKKLVRDGKIRRQKPKWNAAVGSHELLGPPP